MRFFCFYLILLLWTLSCSRGDSIYHTLAKADSLIISHPDSSYAILKSINLGEVMSQIDRAYYALLYTQCLHKNYYPLGNDSLISIATEYYSNKKDKEKYARALLYHGAALEEMNVYSLAMEKYKRADEIADGCDDYLTRGLTNSWIGLLYSRKLIENNEDIEYYKKALEFFRKSGHEANVNYTMSLLGKHYRVGQAVRDSAYHYTNMAIEHAQYRGDSVNLLYNYALLASTYYLEGEFDKSRETCLYILRNRNNLTLSEEVYNCLSRSYANLGQIDSAIFYSRYIKINNRDSISYYITMRQIAENAQDYKNAYRYYYLSNRIADSVIYEARKMDLYDIEKKYDNQKLINANQQLLLTSRTRLFIIVMVLVTTFAYTLHLKRKRRVEVEEKLLFIEKLKNDSLQRINSLTKELSFKCSNESKLNEFLDRKLDVMRQLLDISYRHGSSSNTFLKKFNSIMRIDKLDEGALIDFVEIVNVKYNGVIDNLKNDYPFLSPSEINLIAMVCCGFSSIEMTVFFNYSNEKSIYGRKNRLAVKMKLKSSLDEFVRNYLYK